MKRSNHIQETMTMNDVNLIKKDYKQLENFQVCLQSKETRGMSSG